MKSNLLASDPIKWAWPKKINGGVENIARVSHPGCCRDCDEERDGEIWNQKVWSNRKLTGDQYSCSSPVGTQTWKIDLLKERMSRSLLSRWWMRVETFWRALVHRSGGGSTSSASFHPRRCDTAKKFCTCEEIQFCNATAWNFTVNIHIFLF